MHALTSLNKGDEKCSLSNFPYRVPPERSSESQLVKRQALSASLLDPSSRPLCESQSCYLHRRNFIHSNIIGNCSNDDSNLVLLLDQGKNKYINQHRENDSEGH